MLGYSPSYNVFLGVWLQLRKRRSCPTVEYLSHHFWQRDARMLHLKACSHALVGWGYTVPFNTGVHPSLGFTVIHITHWCLQVPHRIGIGIDEGFGVPVASLSN